MIVQQRRSSKTRGRKRRTHYKLETPGMTVCSNCGELKLNHRVCGECGYYDGKQITTPVVKVEEDKKATKEKK